MFNNPFGSFQDTVAEAKEEREQLDRLLTVSTPRERWLVGAIALLLLGLSAWLFLGTVSRSLAVDGVVVEPGRNVPGGHRSLRALVGIEPGIARHIRAGMPARIEWTPAAGEAATLAGEVTTISTVPLSEGLAALPTVAAVPAYRVGIAIEESLAPAPRAGQECRIVIELGRQAPVALLRRSLPRQPVARLPRHATPAESPLNRSPEARPSLRFGRSASGVPPSRAPSARPGGRPGARASSTTD